MIRLHSINKLFVCIILFILLLKVFMYMGINAYLRHIDIEAEKFLVGANVIFGADEKVLNEQGLYTLNIKDDIDNSLVSDNKLIYKVDGVSFYFDIEILNNSIVINRLVDETHHIKARINCSNVLTIEYQLGNINHSILLKINTENDYKYLAITDNTYYFLGNDIDTIVYKNDQFYYLTYNIKYDALKDAKKCDDKTKRLIDNFNGNDYYYKTGEINFLKDYYQKIKPNYYYVKNHCNDLKKQASE